MSLDVHSVSLLGGSSVSMNDRLRVGLYPNVATAAGGGAGAAVTLTVNATLIPGLSLPANYEVHVTPNQDAVAYVTAKTAEGFTVTLNPRLAANTLAAGTVDILVIGA